MANRAHVASISYGFKDGNIAEQGRATNGVDHKSGNINAAFTDESSKTSAAPSSNGAGKQQTAENTTAAVFRDSTASPSSTPWYFKLSWLLSIISSSIAPVVTVVFFVALYPEIQTSGPLGIQDVNVHVLNLVFVVIDHLISARPVRLLHVIFPIIYGLIYIIFNIIYWSDDHENNVVYSILDWNSPGIAAAVVIGLAVVGLPLLQALFFGLYRLKLYLVKKFNGFDLD